MIIGIDPGATTGGIAIMLDHGEVMMLWEMPSIVELVYEFTALKAGADSSLFAYVEKAQAFPGQGVVSMFNYGLGYGQILGVLGALEIPYELIHPRVWSKEMLTGTSEPVQSKKLKKDKSRNIEAARRLFPSLPELRAKKPDSGIVDALLIAEYGRRRRQGQTRSQSVG